MISSKLPPVLDISNLTSTEEIIEFLYGSLKEEYTGSRNKQYLHGKRIFFDFIHLFNDKYLFFWHLISLSESEKFNILPCNNDVSSFIKCSVQNCLTQSNPITLPNGKNRNICFYRGIRIHWIKKIIELANNKDPFIKEWECEKKREGRKEKNFYIRFEHETTDYLVVLSVRKKGFLFVTAYPLFYINRKQICDKQYEAYQAYKTSMQTAANAEKE
ncbi:MAG: hypothetical protein GX770_05315 [Firmicutes bacterium]|nr:hypothetical protein [Bacillota bacterium]